MKANSEREGSSTRVKVAIVSASAIVLAALVTAVVPPLLRPPPEPVPQPTPQEVAGVTVKIECSGLIHDDDTLGRYQEESFSIDRTINLIPNGTSEPVKGSSQEVGGEVRLDMVLALKATKEGHVSVSGSLELWEGEAGMFFNPEGREKIAETLVPASRSITVYDGRVADKYGDWVDVKLVVEAVPYYKSK